MNIDEIYDEINGLLSEYDIIYSLDDIENLTLENIIQGIHETIVSHIKAPFLLLGIITVIIIFSTFIKSMNKSIFNKNNITDMISVLTAVTVITEPLLTLYSEVSETVIKCGEFINLFVPVFAVTCAMSGTVSAIGTYNGIILGISELIIWLSEKYLIPILTMITALSVTNSIYSKTFFESFIQLINKIIKWIMTVCMGLFVSFITLKNTIGTATDTFATKTVKFVISGFVPVIGSAVSDAYATVKGSIGILKCTIGTAGIISAVFIFMPPVIEVMTFRIVMKIGIVLADMFSVNSVGKLLKSLENGLSIALSVMICFALLFIISTAILMK